MTRVFSEAGFGVCMPGTSAALSADMGATGVAGTTGAGAGLGVGNGEVAGATGAVGTTGVDVTGAAG